MKKSAKPYKRKQKERIDMTRKIDWVMVGVFIALFLGGFTATHLGKQTSEEIRNLEFKRGVKAMADICIHTSERPHRYKED